MAGFRMLAEEMDGIEGALGRANAAADAAVLVDNRSAAAQAARRLLAYLLLGERAVILLESVLHRHYARLLTRAVVVLLHKDVSLIKLDEVRKYADRLIEEFDVRSGDGALSTARSMSGGNQQKAIVGRELDHEHSLLIAIQPTRGLDVGAIESVHSAIVAKRDAGAAVLLISLELDEVMSLSDRILVMYEGEIVGQLDPKKTTVQELGLYMAGAKKDVVKEA